MPARRGKKTGAKSKSLRENRDYAISPTCPQNTTSHLSNTSLLRPAWARFGGSQLVSRMTARAARLQENSNGFLALLDRCCLAACCIKMTIVCQRGRHHLLRFGGDWHAALSMVHGMLLVQYVLLSSMALALSWVQLFQPLSNEPRSRGVAASIAILAGIHLLFCINEGPREFNHNRICSSLLFCTFEVVRPQLMILQKSTSAYGAVVLARLSFLEHPHEQHVLHDSMSHVLHDSKSHAAHFWRLLMLRMSSLAAAASIAGSVMIALAGIVCAGLHHQCIAWAPVTFSLLGSMVHLGAGITWFMVVRTTAKLASSDGSSYITLQVFGAAWLGAAGR
jgi:hypothetical protein